MDKQVWHDLLSRFQIHDVNYLPEYLEIYERETNRDAFIHYGGQGFLCVYGDENNIIIYSFFKRRIADLGFADQKVNEWYDIISPYGYCGPRTYCKDPSVTEALWQGFFPSFHAFCIENKIISEFARLHPFVENQIPLSHFSQGITEKLGQIIYVDLGLSENELFDSMARGHRRHYRRALENSLTFCTKGQVNDARNFFNLYTQTMERTKADNKYYFSQAFFDFGLNNLGDTIKFWRVTFHNEIISGWLIMKCDDLAYAWLSGTKEEYFNLFPSNYLVFQTILQLKKEGCKTFILGGGKSVKNDTVFRYKEGFSPLKKDYFIYKQVHLPKEYDKLVQLQGEIAETATNYFPKYRANSDIQFKGQISSQEEHNND
jgi:hypothetical protein